MARQPARLLKYGFVAPALVILIALNIFPLLYNIVLSFTNADLIGGQAESVGVSNYSVVFSRPGFAAAVRTTALFTAAAVGIELIIGFGIALAIHRNFRGKGIILTILLIPMMLSPAVMGLFWHQILNGHYGVLNQLLGAAGLPQPQWLTAPNLKLISILMIDIWMWTPFMMLISLAALNSIPPHIYEAAEIDRASALRVFRKITLPMSAPLLVLAALLRTTDALKQFDLVMATTGSNDAATQTLSAMLYQTVFRGGKVGLGSAYACVILVLVIAVASIFVRYIDHIQQRHGRVGS